MLCRNVAKINGSTLRWLELLDTRMCEFKTAEMGISQASTRKLDRTFLKTDHKITKSGWNELSKALGKMPRPPRFGPQTETSTASRHYGNLSGLTKETFEALAIFPDNVTMFEIYESFREREKTFHPSLRFAPGAVSSQIVVWNVIRGAGRKWGRFTGTNTSHLVLWANDMSSRSSNICDMTFVLAESLETCQPCQNVRKRARKIIPRNEIVPFVLWFISANMGEKTDMAQKRFICEATEHEMSRVDKSNVHFARKTRKTRGNFRFPAVSLLIRMIRDKACCSSRSKSKANNHDLLAS